MSRPPHGRPLLCLVAALALLAVLVALALACHPAAAGGSGDYPPPASGSWYIYQKTSVWSEGIEMRGNVFVYAALSMNLVDLSFDCDYDTQYGLYIYDPGSLTFNNGNITAVNRSNHYRFLTYGPTTIRNSELSEAYYGLEVYTKDFTLTDSDVFDMYSYGVQMVLWYTLRGNVLIKGNTFVNNRNFGLFIYQYAYLDRFDSDAVLTGNITISANKFKGNLGGGVYIYRYMYGYWSKRQTMLTNLTIEGNEIVANRGNAIYVYTYLYSYQGADEGILTYKGAINVNNNTIKDNQAWQTVYYQNYIAIYYGSDAIIDSAINMVGNTITGNKDTYSVEIDNSIYEYYGRDAKVRIDVRFEGNNISRNGGHAVYISSYSNTDRGDKGVCTNDGNIVFRDNVIHDNLGSGVYVYRQAYASYSAFASIKGDIVFEDNNIKGNQGYGGAYIYSYAYKYAGDPNASAKVRGDVRFVDNTFENNLGYGAYVYAYSRSYYGGDSEVRGDVLFKGNTINSNAGYGGLVYYDAYKQMGAEKGVARVVSNATFVSNTMSRNSGYHGFYYQKYATTYSSSYSVLNGTVTAEGNTIEYNKGFGFYIYASSYNYQSSLGNTYITGDIWVRDNIIRHNEGGGVYIYCYSSAYRAKSSEVFQNITFSNNVVTHNGYSGLVVSIGGYSNRAIGGDTRIVGDVGFYGNNVSANLYDGIYLYRYAGAEYTEGTKVLVDGDVRVENNTANSNYGYGIFLYQYTWNTQGGLTGRTELKADHIVRNNTVSNNLNWYSIYIFRYVYGYYTGRSVLDSDLLVEDNIVSSNRGIGIISYDYGYQFYYGGSGVPDRGNYTQRGTMRFVRNTVTTNAGTGIHINSTIDAQERRIEAAPVIEWNVISYNYGSYGLYCDLRDVTRPINVRNNTMEHNEVYYVALLSNSGTAPDMFICDNVIRYNKVYQTTVGLTIGSGNFNATVSGNNISYNDAADRVLYMISTGRLTIDRNHFLGNINATDTLMVTGAADTSTITITNNELRDNAGNGVAVYTLGSVLVKGNTIDGNEGSGVRTTTDTTLEKPLAVMRISNNRVTRNAGNGIWGQSINVLEVGNNTVTGNGLAGVRVNAMKNLPTIDGNVIDGNKWGIYLTGDKLAPLTTTYTFVGLTVTGSTQEGLYAEDLTLQLRGCKVVGSKGADLAVRRGRMDCYSATVGYLSGNVYESGRIHVWWRIDIDVRWQSGVPVPAARVLMAAHATNETYREFETDAGGHIGYFNAEEWSKVDMAVHPWSPYDVTASKDAESSTQLETVNRSRNIIIILRDAHVPTVAITEPLEGALINASTIAVKGTAGDGGSGLVAVRMRLDSGPWAELGKVATFARSFTVPDGKHTITVQGEDLAGMLGNATVNITVDTEPPKVRLLRPLDGTLTNATLIEVEGMVLEPELAVDINGIPQAILPDNHFKETLRLYEGPNLIRVFARDLAGNTRLLLANVTLDTVAPPLSIDFPQDRHLTRSPALEVRGRSEPGATVSAKGSTAKVGGSGAFVLVVNLTEGENLLIVMAKDPAGNPTQIALHVTLDTVAPSLTIEEPKDGLLTKADKLRVVGTVEMEDGLVLSVGGSFVLPVGGRYNYTVDLVEGKNVITVTARDRVGNEAHANRTVIRRTIAPELRITNPPRDYMPTNRAHFTITGVTAPDVDLTIQGVPVEVRPDGNFSGTVDLVSGENAVVVEAKDALGNTAKVIIHLVLDTEPPALVVESPYSGRTEDSTVNVTGRTDVGADLTINGVAVAVDDKGRFRLTMPLRYGDQNITVVASDLAGNEATVNLQVTRVRPEEPPEPPGPGPSVVGGGAGVLIVIVLIAVAAAGGYLYINRRRRLG